MKAIKKEPLVLTLVIISAILLFNPTYNIIDPLPDFIAFLSLALIIGNNGELLPYFKEAKEALLKLSLVSFLKIPGMMIMYANLSTGRDIIPLFTLTFGIFELIWIIPAIDNGFSAIFYIGERTELNSLISPYKLCGKKVTTDFLKKLTLVFFVLRPILTLLPELCVLTLESTELTAFLYSLYPLLLIVCVGFVLLLGIFWMCHVIAYARATLSKYSIYGVIKELAGKERLEWLKDKCILKSKLAHLTILGLGSLLFLDFRFAESENANVLPHFIYGIILLIVALKLFNDFKLRLFATLFSIGFGVASTVAYVKTFSFLSEYSFIDVLKNSLARKEYEAIELFSIIELVCFLLLMALMCIGMVKFIQTNTAIEPTNPSYSRQDKDYHRSMCIRSIIAFSFAAFIAILKCLNVFLEGNAVLIFTESSAIVSSAAPWLPTLIFALTVIFFIYTMHFISLLKDDVTMKYHRD